MTKTSSKTKGHRFEKATFHIPYYTASFFKPEEEVEEGEVTSKPSSTVKIPVKIDKEGDDSHSNILSFPMKTINHFDNNVEDILNSISQLYERVIKPKGINDPNNETKQTLKLMELICEGPARDTLQDAKVVRRSDVYDEYVR